MTCRKQALCGASKGVNNSEGTWGLCKRCETLLKEREEGMCKEGNEDISLSPLISFCSPFDLPDKKKVSASSEIYLGLIILGDIKHKEGL